MSPLMITPKTLIFAPLMADTLNAIQARPFFNNSPKAFAAIVPVLENIETMKLIPPLKAAEEQCGSQKICFETELIALRWMNYLLP